MCWCSSLDLFLDADESRRDDSGVSVGLPTARSNRESRDQPPKSQRLDIQIRRSSFLVRYENTWKNRLKLKPVLSRFPLKKLASFSSGNRCSDPQCENGGSFAIFKVPRGADFLLFADHPTTPCCKPVNSVTDKNLQQLSVVIRVYVVGGGGGRGSVVAQSPSSSRGF